MTELVIFDCDGVLIDSDRISLRVRAEKLCELGVPSSYDAGVRDFLGIGMPATLVAIAARLGRPLPPSWIDELDQAVRTMTTAAAKGVVVEDSPCGVHAAKAARMRVLATPLRHPRTGFMNWFAKP